MNQMRYLVAEVHLPSDGVHEPQIEAEHFFCAWIIEFPQVFVWGDSEESAIHALSFASDVYFSCKTKN